MLGMTVNPVVRGESKANKASSTARSDRGPQTPLPVKGRYCAGTVGTKAINCLAPSIESGPFTVLRLVVLWAHAN